MANLYERLEKALGIVNEHDFARVGEALVWIGYRTNHPNAQGYTDRRAVVHFLARGAWRAEVFRSRHLEEQGLTPAEERRLCVEAAQGWVHEKLGREVTWVAGPFQNSWMPRDVRERVMSKLKDAEQKAEGDQ